MRKLIFVVLQRRTLAAAATLTLGAALTGCGAGLEGLAATGRDPIAAAAEDAVAKIGQTAATNAQKQNAQTQQGSTGEATKGSVALGGGIDKPSTFTFTMPHNVRCVIKVRTSSSSKTFRNVDVEFTNQGSRSVTVSWSYTRSSTPANFPDGTPTIAPGGKYSSWNGMEAGPYYFHYTVRPK